MSDTLKSIATEVGTELLDMPLEEAKKFGKAFGAWTPGMNFKRKGTGDSKNAGIPTKIKKITVKSVTKGVDAAKSGASLRTKFNDKSSSKIVDARSSAKAALGSNKKARFEDHTADEHKKHAAHHREQYSKTKDVAQKHAHLTLAKAHDSAHAKMTEKKPELVKAPGTANMPAGSMKSAERIQAGRDRIAKEIAANKAAELERKNKEQAMDAKDAARSTADTSKPANRSISITALSKSKDNPGRQNTGRGRPSDQYIQMSRNKLENPPVKSMKGDLKASVAAAKASTAFAKSASPAAKKAESQKDPGHDDPRHSKYVTKDDNFHTLMSKRAELKGGSEASQNKDKEFIKQVALHRMRTEPVKSHESGIDKAQLSNARYSMEVVRNKLGISRSVENMTPTEKKKMAKHYSTQVLSDEKYSKRHSEFHGKESPAIQASDKLHRDILKIFGGSVKVKEPMDKNDPEYQKKHRSRGYNNDPNRDLV